MKKILSLLLALCLCCGLCLSLTSCDEVLEKLADLGGGLFDFVGEKAEGLMSGESKKIPIDRDEWYDFLNTTNVEVVVQIKGEGSAHYYFADGVVMIEQDGMAPEYMVIEDGQCYYLRENDDQYFAAEIDYDELTFGEMFLDGYSYDSIVYNEEYGAFCLEDPVYGMLVLGFSDGRLAEMIYVLDGNEMGGIFLYGYGEVEEIELPYYELPDDSNGN